MERHAVEETDEGSENRTLHLLTESSLDRRVQGRWKDLRDESASGNGAMDRGS